MFKEETYSKPCWLFHSFYSALSKMGMSVFSTLQEINISHLRKRKIIFKMDFSGDMLVPRRVNLLFIVSKILLHCDVWWLVVVSRICSFLVLLTPAWHAFQVSDLDKIYIQLCIDVDTFIETVWSPSFCYAVVDFLFFLGRLGVRPKIQESENQAGGWVTRLPLKDNSDEDTFEVWAWFAHFQASLSPYSCLWKSESPIFSFEKSLCWNGYLPANLTARKILCFSRCIASLVRLKDKNQAPSWSMFHASEP